MKNASELDAAPRPEGKRFYVYELRDDAGKVFYVGKGTGKRIKRHRELARSKECPKSYVYNAIRKMWAEGRDFTEHEVFTTCDEKLAHLEEVRLIAFYGRENLCNLTDGGEGNTGLKMSNESKKKMRDAKIRRRPEGFRLSADLKTHEIDLKSLPESYINSRLYDKINREGPQPDQANEYYKNLSKCWLWIGAKNKKGFGITSVKAAHVQAHRLIYMVEIGEIPKGMSVLHRCDLRECTNPSHLFLGTVRDSVDLKMAKGRHRVCPPEKMWMRVHPERLPRGDNHYMRKNPEKIRRGEASFFAKLTEEKVREARRRNSAGESVNSIRKDFGLSHITLSRAIQGKTWSHVVD